MLPTRAGLAAVWEGLGAMGLELYGAIQAHLLGDLRRAMSLLSHSPSPPGVTGMNSQKLFLSYRRKEHVLQNIFL